MASILDETGNLLRIYLHHCGQSEVPKAFQVWSAFAMVAACVSDRVFLYKNRERPLYPNLYTILIGPSGLGKGEAIDTVGKFIQKAPDVGYYEGRATAALLVDHLHKRSKKTGSARMFLVTPELKMSVGSGALAEDFVVKMTEWYKGRAELKDGTRTDGEKTLTNLCMNWLAGTTREWMLESLSRSAVEGGFLGRCITVEAPYNLDLRFRRPLYPDDYEECVDHLKARIKALLHVEGQMVLDAQAEAIEDAWYAGRQPPKDEGMIPTWKRQHDLVLKLAMVLSLMDGGDLVVNGEHMALALNYSAVAQKAVPAIVRAASVTRETRHLEIVRELIFRRKALTAEDLLKICSSQIERSKIKQAVSFLLEMHEIQLFTTKRKRKYYVWLGKTRSTPKRPKHVPGLPEEANE